MRRYWEDGGYVTLTKSGYLSFILHSSNTPQSSGVFTSTASTIVGYTGSGYYAHVARYNSANVVPTAAKNQTRAYGSLACVYLGQPAS